MWVGGQRWEIGPKRSHFPHLPAILRLHQRTKLRVTHRVTSLTKKRQIVCLFHRILEKTSNIYLSEYKFFPGRDFRSIHFGKTIQFFAMLAYCGNVCTRCNASHISGFLLSIHNTVYFWDNFLTNNNY